MTDEDGRLKTLCVHWPRLGPYHIARLKDLSEKAAKVNVKIVALEIAGDDSVYEWRKEELPGGFLRHTIFPDRQFHHIPPKELHAGVIKALDELRPDTVAIHSYSFPDARACLYWCKTRDRRAIMMIDSKEDDASRSWWKERIKRNIVQSYDAALVAGRPQRRYMESLGIKPDRLLDGYHVIDNDYFAERSAYFRAHPEEAARLPGLADSSPFFLASNRFIKRKNLAMLVRAYAAYREKTASPWRLVLLGDGPERSRLERMIADANIDGVSITGFRQIEDLPAYYAHASAFVHPASQDMWGLVVNEAMACGLPVIVSSQSGCAEDLVQPGKNGYVFSAVDSEELVERLLTVSSLENSELAGMGKVSRDIIAGWNLDRFSNNLLALNELAHRAPANKLSISAGMTIRILLKLARRPDSFHAIPEEKAK